MGKKSNEIVKLIEDFANQIRADEKQNEYLADCSADFDQGAFDLYSIYADHDHDILVMVKRVLKQARKIDGQTKEIHIEKQTH